MQTAKRFPLAVPEHSVEPAMWLMILVLLGCFCYAIISLLEKVRL